MRQLTKNQAVATSQEAVQNENEPQLRDENAHNDKSVHGVLNPTYQAGLRRLAIQPFFFQAEDGIRDSSVTGVQTCALPIYLYTIAVLIDKPDVRQVAAALNSLLNNMDLYKTLQSNCRKASGYFNWQEEEKKQIGRASCRERV